MGEATPRQSLPIVLAVLAGVTVVGLFGPWFDYGVAFAHKSYNGLEGGGLLAALPVAAVVTGAIVRLRQQGERAWPAIVMAAGFMVSLVWGFVVAAILWKRFSDEIGDMGFSFGRIGWGLPLYFVASLVGLVLGIVQWVQDARRPGLAPAFGARQISPGNHSSAPVVPSPRVRPSAPAASSAGRIGVVRAGQRFADLQLGENQVVVVGRNGASDVHLGDRHVSRRHLEIRLLSGGWSVRDLSNGNFTRVVGPQGEQYLSDGKSLRLAGGQLLVGDAVITLYPVK